MFRRSFSLVVILAIAALASGCSQKAPAEAAITAAETAFTAVQDEAGKYLPDQAKAVSDAIAAAKDSVAKGEYKAALTAAQAIPAQITALGTAVAAKKAELTTAWNGLNESLPQVVKGIEDQIATLEKATKLPKGFDKAKLEEAKTGLAGLTAGWSEATTAFGAGNLTEALAKAEAVKASSAKVMELLQPAPAAVPAAVK
ncbi:MAG: hypothetical protein H6Q10_3112 [Acidobacteria bacterium]|nr:hypothetical protein [Acidobacteriota bacterium]